MVGLFKTYKNNEKVEKSTFFEEKREKKPIFAARKNRRELSSVGSEHRPYKAGVVGSSPTVPTPETRKSCTHGFLLFLRSVFIIG